VVHQFKYEIANKPLCCNDAKPDAAASNKPIPKFYQHRSPSFDSLNYWFLKKSINLYGEAFVKTIAAERNKFADTDTGISIIKKFWQQRGIETSAINMLDGSGLSPANRITTAALVTVMQYAKKQSWFNSFYYALPEINGIKMKDGYIGGVRSYTGYIKSKTGVEYTFSLIVNNFSGAPSTVREKMWGVLNILK
jgi:serine-type D-Ala-D-Ala carboxypeptidase/endopeptidase (penicillin-binding protein 4)